MITSTPLYNTFGNEIKYKIVHDTLVAYLENATVKFPLPEAGVDMLVNLANPSPDAINSDLIDQINQQLVALGFKQAQARAFAIVLIKVAKVQGVNPQEYFNLSRSALKLALDSYNFINQELPAGNRIGLVQPIRNERTRVGDLIKP